MGELKKILVAVDGSEASLHALKEALRLARSKDGEVLAVSVAPRYEGDLRVVGVSDLKALLREPCEKALSETMKVAMAEGIPFQTACVEGEPHEEIVDLADSKDFDLIVMGMGGDSFERFRLGSITARVIGYSQRDVLVVPVNTAIGWKRLLLATDGSKYSLPVSQRAIKIAKSYGAKLYIVSATNLPPEFYAQAPKVGEELVEKAKANVAQAKKLAASNGIETECLVREAEAHKAIVNLAKENSIEMIIMGSHGRTGLKRLLLGSVVERVIGRAPCPVLVVKA